MIEKVSPGHPDKICDRIAGAIVDAAYAARKDSTSPGEIFTDPRIAVEVMAGHGTCHIIIETDADISGFALREAVDRIAGESVSTSLVIVPQDPLLAKNPGIGDNGIFRGVPLTVEQQELGQIAREIYSRYPYDGKYILDDLRLIICQSNADTEELEELYPGAEVNPLGPWIGGLKVDTGAVNRKIGSDMAEGATGGGLHGKDLSKADVAVNVWAFLQAQKTGKPVEYCCAIGDEKIGDYWYKDIADEAADYIIGLGGFERLAEWGLW